jgi:hypothetical protein
MYPVNRATSASLYPGRHIDADDDRAYVGAMRILIGALNPVDRGGNALSGRVHH